MGSVSVITIIITFVIILAAAYFYRAPKPKPKPKLSKKESEKKWMEEAFNQKIMPSHTLLRLSRFIPVFITIIVGVSLFSPISNQISAATNQTTNQTANQSQTLIDISSSSDFAAKILSIVPSIFMIGILLIAIVVTREILRGSGII